MEREEGRGKEWVEIMRDKRRKQWCEREREREIVSVCVCA